MTMSTIKLTRGMAEDQGAGQPFCYLVTDIETDGPEPGGNSMLSFASVIVDQHGQQGNAFEACLEPLPDARSDPDTLAWLQSQPEVWADATRDPLPAEQVMQNYVQWIRQLPTLGNGSVDMPVAPYITSADQPTDLRATPLNPLGQPATATPAATSVRSSARPNRVPGRWLWSAAVPAAVQQ
jgi:hypothetical protein